MPKVLLTDKLIRSLATDQAQEDFWDTSLPGFGVRVSRQGRQTFFFSYRTPGQGVRVRRTLGHFPQMSLADARKRARGEQVQLDQGIDPRQDPAVASESEGEHPLTFGELAATYLRQHPKQGTRWWTEQKRVIEKELMPVWGDRPADSIRKREVSDLLHGILGRPAPVQANRTRAITNRLFNYGITRDLVVVNPVFGTEKPAEEVGRERVLSDDELRRIWRLFGELVPTLGLHLRFKLFTLQRGCEIRTMEHSHLDGGWWTVPRELTKTKRRDHRVFLTASALELLAEAEKVCSGPKLFFPSPRNPELPVDIGAPAQACRRLWQRYGIATFTPHDLRRTAATNLGALGVDELLIARILSHTTESGEKRVPTVTGLYNRYRYDAEKQAAMELWEKRLLEIIASPASSI